VPQKPRGVADVLVEFGGRVEYDDTIAKPSPGKQPYASTLPATSTASIAMLSEPLVDTNQGLTVGKKVGPLTWLALHGRGDLAARILARDRKLAPSDRFLPYFAGRVREWELALEAIGVMRDVDASDRAGVTPLMLAADAGRADVVKVLLAKGANVNARSASDWPPIWETSPLMLFGGHSPSKPPLVGGYTALKAARERRHDDVAAILVQAGGRD
jgi:hypothetical protein